MKNAGSPSRRPLRPLADASAAREPTPALQVAGLLGSAVIGGTLAIVRAWAWLTRTPFYKD